MSDAGNPLSGHTAANYASSLGVDGLKDGDQILSASLTNLYEGVHGNGILLIEDTAIGETDRNNADNLPGAIATHSDAEKVTIKGGEMILDGVVYGFAGGYNSSTKAPETFTISLTKNSANKIGTINSLSSGKECIFTIYLSSEDDTSVKHINFEQGSIIDTAANAYSTSPSAYLKTPNDSNSVAQTVVIATIRAVYNGSASGANSSTSSPSSGLNLTITEINDKRVFVKPTPIYLTPVTSGASNSTAAVNNIDTALDNLHSGQVGDFNASNLGAIWMSYDASGNNVLYFSGKQDGSRRTFKLGPDNIYMDTNWVTGDGHITFKFDADNVFLLTPNNSGLQLNPIGTFPPGHLVQVFNDGGSPSMTFNATNAAGGGSGSSALSQAIATATSMVFCFDGTNWKKIMTSSTGSASVTSYTNSTNNRVLTSVDGTTINGEANLLFSGSLLEVGAAAGSGVDAKLYTAGTAAHVGLHWDADGATEGTLYGGVDDHGVDLKFFGETAGKFIHWDMSADTFFVSGTLDSDGPITVGVDDTGYDVKFFGATAGAYMLWDESQDDLILGGAATLGIGETVPGTALQVSTSEPYITLKNTTAENTDGGAESRIIFEDHDNAALAQIQGSHDGTADDTKGDLIFSTHSGSSLVEALRIDSTKLATFAGDVTVTGDLTINGATSSISVQTLNVDNPLIEVGLTDGAAPSADAQKDLGLKMHWHTGSAAKIAALVLDESTSASAPSLTFIPDATDTSGVMSGTVGSMVANLVGDQSGGSVSASTITGSGDVAIDTDTLFVDVSEDAVGINQSTPLAPLQIASSGFGQVDVSANTAAQNVNLFDKTEFRGAKITISTTNVTDTSYETAEMVLTHDGSDAFITVYGVVSSTGAAQVTYSADINSDDVRVVLTPVGSDNCSYKIAWKALTV